MSRGSLNDKMKLDEFLRLCEKVEGRYDPRNLEQARLFLSKFEITVSQETEAPLVGSWSALWRHGGGVMCPPMPEEEAVTLIALSCYLYLVGVEVSLTDELAYWCIRGPQLLSERNGHQP